MPLSFPSSPTVGQTYTVGTRTWTWDGTIWSMQAATLGVASISTAEIADGAVTTEKIAAGAVVEADIASNAVTAAKIASNAVTTEKLGNDVQLGYRNRIVNGGFDVWQRGTSFTLTNNTDTYTADRWLNWFNGSSNGTQTASRQTHTVGQTDVPGNPTYFFRWTGTTLGTGQTVIDLRQRIEGVAIGAGQTVTYTYYAKSSSALASGSVSIFFSQVFGSGGSATVDTTATLSATSTTTGWVRYTATATLPSISGKTVGTSHYLQVLMRFSNIVNGLSIDVSNAQFEVGSVATPFEFEHYGTTLAKCQRYYQTSYQTGVTPGSSTVLGNSLHAGWAASASGAIAGITYTTLVTMRAEPTQTLYDLAGNSARYTGVAADGTQTNNLAFNTQGVHQSGGYGRLYGVAYSGMAFQWVHSAEL